MFQLLLFWLLMTVMVWQGSLTLLSYYENFQRFLPLHEDVTMLLENVQVMLLLLCQTSQLEKGKCPACCNFAATDKSKWVSGRND